MYFAPVYFATAYFARAYFSGGPVMPTVFPNGRHTYVMQSEDDVGTFPPYTPGETDPLTFDVAAQLDSGESISSITSFTLFAPSDATPEARILSAPQLQGTQLSVLLGNWQPIRYINYLVTVMYVTNQAEVLTAQGYVAVERPRRGYH